MDLSFVIHRSNVNAWECDENGHLNVRYFIGKNYQGLVHLLAEVGLTPTCVQRYAVLRARLASQHVRFHLEARLALPITIHGAVVAHNGASIELYSELRHTVNDTLYTSFNSEIEIVDLKDGQRRSVEIDDWGSGFELPKHGRIRSLPPGDVPVAALADALAMGYMETGRGTVLTEECDPHGRMEIYQYSGRMSDCIANFSAMTQSDEEFSRRGSGELGSAVIESRVDYDGELHVGDRFAVVSGLRSFTTKTQRLSHLMFDLDTGQLVAHNQGIAVALDLKTRRAVPFSEDRKARMLDRQLRVG